MKIHRLTFLQAGMTIAFSFAVSASFIQPGCAQSILGGNLIANGNAEAGPAGMGVSSYAKSIPNWSVSGNANVLSYGLPGLLQTSDPAPSDHGFNYFVAPLSTVSSPGLGSLTQTVDISSGASAINTGNVKFTAAAYLGSANGAGIAPAAQIVFAFKSATGQTFTTSTLGPLGLSGNGMSMQQQIGLVPPGTTQIMVTLTLNSHCKITSDCAYAVADDLSLVLTMLNSSPGMVLGTNLIANPGAEVGPGSPSSSMASYVPGWSTANAATVAPYGGNGWIATTDPGPVNRGVNLFYGGLNGAYMYQNLDVSAAAALIDANQVTFQVSAWLGAVSWNNSPSLIYTFFDWTGKQLAPTAQLGPVSHPNTGVFETSKSGTIPAGTRRVNVLVTFPDEPLNIAFSVADDMSFTLAAPTGPPVITSAGIVTASAFGGSATISPGGWIEIYGTDLASTTLGWSGSDFVNGVGPTNLGGVSVSVGGKAAYVDYVSPGQVNALVSSDAPTGAVPVTITNANGTSDQFWLIVNPTAPGLLAPSSFNVSGKQYVAAILPDGTFAIPTAAVSGVASRPAKAGETVTIYGVGFGSTTGGFTAGTLVTQENSLISPLIVTFGSAQAALAYAGLAPSYTGLYQLNLVVPNVSPNNTLALSLTLGGTKGTQTLYIAVSN